MDVKKILDILAIVLPVILIVFAFLRVDGRSQPSPRIRFLNGFTLLIAVLLLLIGCIRYFFFPGGGGSSHSDPKPLPMAVSKHSDRFNNSVSSVLKAYYNMTESFVNWDTLAITKDAADLKTSLDNLSIDELKTDSGGIYESALDPLTNAKAEAATLRGNSAIDKKR